jgi:putative ABC transport system substrate-binding protein
MSLLIFLLIVLAAPVAAQTTGERIYRLGQLAPSDASLEITRSATLPELARLGFSEGHNLVIDMRVGDATTLPGLARELLLARVDAIIAIGPDAIRAARDATSTVPIIMFGADPVGQGYAASLARPGGNITGVMILASELDGKRLDLLREAIPAARRVAALMQPSAPGRQTSEQEMRAVAARVGLELLIFDAGGPDEYPNVFAAMRAAGAQGLVIMANALFNRDARPLAALAMEASLPTICEWAEMARDGCLLGYGPDRVALRRRVADYAARIFRGALPGEMPIEAPAIFELAINLRTARALGMTIPPSLLIRAEEVIE